MRSWKCSLSPFLFTLLLIKTCLVSTALTSVSPRNGSSVSEDDFFAEITKPRDGDTLVTGSAAQVRWKTGRGDGQVMLEVADGRGEMEKFVYVECALPHLYSRYSLGGILSRLHSRVKLVARELRE